MAAPRTFGRYPTLAETRVYYNRDDVLAFLFMESRLRNVTLALHGKHQDIHPTSVEALRELINETIRTQIAPIYDDDSPCMASLQVPIEVYSNLYRVDLDKQPPGGYTVFWHGTTIIRRLLKANVLKNLG